ncbi:MULTISPECIES: hypothetical protein [Providencia]|uniref:hypothetical protein n=1 Tax=Providencia TaxID=586 RepID=UPI00234BF666|nr:hypothetical protein [Providencia sp. PROV143]
MGGISTTSAVNNALPVFKKNDRPISFSNDINSVNNVGLEVHFPLKEQAIDKTFNLSGNGEDLHSNNQKLQANIIESLLIENKSSISLEMITKTLNLGHAGSLQEQKLQYQPENALIVLTLLTPDEIKESKVLDCAAELIKQVNKSNSDKDLKQVLKSSQKALEAELFDNILSDQNIDELNQRFIDKYVHPAIKEKLRPFLSEKTIEELPIDKLFDASLQKKINGLITEAKNQLVKHKTDKSVDRLLQLHNIFSASEQYIEIMGSLSISINTDGKAENVVTSSSKKDNKLEDTVDSGTDPIILPTSSEAGLSRLIGNNVTIHNDYSMPKELSTVSNEEEKARQQENKSVDNRTPESVQKNSIEEGENKARMPRFKSTLDIPQVSNELPAVLTGDVSGSGLSSVDELRQSILDSSRDPSAQASRKLLAPAESKFNPDINALLPKSMVSARRFEAVEVTDKMTGKTKKIWQDKAPPADKVILTWEGALTPNLTEKIRYGDGQIASSTKKMGIPDNTNTFSNRFEPTKIVDEVTGKTKVKWQLSD